jgi:hypothetical protein
MKLKFIQNTRSFFDVGLCVWDNLGEYYKHNYTMRIAFLFWAIHIDFIKNKNYEGYN